jgi:c-di-GMP-binding flagellar brake protein YcgR
MSLSDRRRYPRFPFHSRAQLLLKDLELNGTLLDISLAGALFATDEGLDFPIRTGCQLAIYRHRRSSFSAIDGEIVHRANHLFGIRFLTVGDTAEDELRQMIDMNLALPHLLKRDLPALLR